MISRRILRVKVMQVAYAYFLSSDGEINKFEKELQFSINKSYDLYHYLLIIPIDLANFATKQIELAKNKKRPTPEDLNPNTRFIDNKIIDQLRKNEALVRYVDTKKLSWANYPEMIKKMYHQMLQGDHYQVYMKAPKNDFEEDKKLIISLFYNEILNNDLLISNLEEQSIYWNDELEFVLGMIEKTIKKFKANDHPNKALMPLYKNDEDKEFSKKLFRKLILNHAEYRKLIENYTKNWDIDRIAFMDILLMQLAISEAVVFPSIPTRVTLNEYLDISKYYSTQKSSVFINGILDRVFNYLKEQNKIQKQGRGLIGEV